jgi:hypothetical protein
MDCSNCGMDFEPEVIVGPTGTKRITKWCLECRKLSKEKDSHHLRCRKKKITPFEFDFILEKQKNRCAICKNVFLSKQEALIEHDHLTKKIRGLCCSSCNVILGNFKDNPLEVKKRILLLQNVIEYLEGECPLDRKVKE